ncbi:MAG: diadenylate cyclase CdaA [Oscillospiraceae bacterium]|nr:diadenylate cyclase CdaA [Oscillospiraceae bacterium]
MLESVINAVTTNAINAFNVFSSFGFADFFDVAAMAFIIYQAFKIVRETRAMQFVKALAVIFAVYFISGRFNLIGLHFIVDALLNVGIIALVVLFQPELRRALEQVGRSKISDINVFGTPVSGESERVAQIQELIATLSASCRALSAQKTGALIVVEREIKLGDVAATGTQIDSKPSPELIENIFFNKSPLHDGAMIIRENRLYAAGCYLPLSGNMEIARDLGTRHRAALGISEVSDAVVIVVSEESGKISAAVDSRLQRGLSEAQLQRLLTYTLSAESAPDHSAKHPLSKILQPKNGANPGKSAKSKKSGKKKGK